jgi:hypothetical protein
LPKEEIDPKTKLLLAGGRGDITVFSGSHLHSSQDNLKNEKDHFYMHDMYAQNISYEF